jgi:hypothetical protein
VPEPEREAASALTSPATSTQKAPNPTVNRLDLRHCQSRTEEDYRNENYYYVRRREEEQSPATALEALSNTKQESESGDLQKHNQLKIESDTSIPKALSSQANQEPTDQTRPPKLPTRTKKSKRQTLEIARDQESLQTFNDIMSNYGNRNKTRSILSKTKPKG